MSGKLGMTTTQRKAVLRNQASNLLWYGRLETTLGRAKELRPYAEKIITLAMNTYDDTVETTVVVKDKKGKDVTTKVLKDGPKKLAARRKIMTLVYDLQEQRGKETNCRRSSPPYREDFQRNRSQVRSKSGRTQTERRLHENLSTR